jgi:hypothetical protein
VTPFDIPILPGNQSHDSKLFNISSVGKFILAGDWNMTFDNVNGSSVVGNNTALRVQGFEADFRAVFEDGTGAHTHQITNLQPSRVDSSKAVREDINNTTIPYNTLTPEGNAFILRTVDVGMNGQKAWENVNADITVSKGRTIEIMLDERDVDYHFGKGQPIYGLVNTPSLNNSPEV